MTSSFLIVDEDRNFREALAISLRLDGHDAVVAASLDDAREQLRARSFWCCVVDAHLVGSDLLLQEAAASGARAVATGPYAELLVPVARRHPRVVALAKPFRVPELLRLVAAPTRAAG
jgi:DNA-binding NtrC family response regulator